MGARRRFLSLFLISTALIMYELAAMRMFAITSWSHFGSLVISTALLGFGLSGTLLTFIGRRLESNVPAWLYRAATLFMPTLAAAHVLGQRIPFNPIFIGSDPLQLVWIGLYYVVYGVPFFFGASFIGISFLAHEGKVHGLHFWNMLGSSLGGLAIVPLMYLLPPASLVLPVLLLACGASLVAAIEQGPIPGARTVLPVGRLAATACAFVASAALVFIAGDPKVSEYKSISYMKKYPDAVEVHRSWSPVGEMNVYASSSLHFAPGLSDNAVLNLKTMPRQPYWGLYVDGGGPVGIMGALRQDEAAYLDWLPMAAPYTLMERPKVLLVNLGGAISAQMARYKDAASVTIAERDPEVVRLLREDPAVSTFTGHLLDDPLIHLAPGEPRAHCAAHRGAYDLVEISLVDSVGLSDPGGYSVAENYTYTVEALRTYLGALAPGGILSLTVWNRLDPPRNVLRLLATVVEALGGGGATAAQDRLFVFDLYLSTATILVKNGPFTAGEIYDLRKFADARSFDTVWYPGIPKRDVDFDTIMNTYQRHFSGGAALSTNTTFTTSDVYHLALQKMLAGRGEDVTHAYPFDVRPMRDDRPYYTGFLRLDRLGMYLDQVRDVSEEWGELLVLGILLQAVLFGLVVVLLPVAGRWRDLFRQRRGVPGVILYYAALGLAYMMVEMFLMQRLVFFLGDPVYSTALVISSMLVLSALGNLAAPLIAKRRTLVVRIAVCVILASLAFYVFGLQPLFDRFLNSPMVVRVLLSIAIIAPAAFFMGMPFPTGLEALTERRPRLLPWAWGMNGGLSVAGTALAQVAALGAGFPLVLGIVAVMYIAVAVIFPVNEIADAEPPG
jgi:hypothetical protein